MSYWSNNPELLDEITTRSLPTFWRNFVEYGLLDLCEVPEHIRYKAMLEGERDYWGSRIDEAKMRHEEGRLSS